VLLESPIPQGVSRQHDVLTYFHRDVRRHDAFAASSAVTSYIQTRSVERRASLTSRAAKNISLDVLVVSGWTQSTDRLKCALSIFRDADRPSELTVWLTVRCVAPVFACLSHLLCIVRPLLIFDFFFFASDAGLLASSQYSEGPATGHLDTDFSRFPSVYKQTLRRFPTFPLATTCFSCSPPDLNLLVTDFVFCLHVK